MLLRLILSQSKIPVSAFVQLNLNKITAGNVSTKLKAFCVVWHDRKAFKSDQILIFSIYFCKFLFSVY